MIRWLRLGWVGRFARAIDPAPAWSARSSAEVRASLSQAAPTGLTADEAGEHAALPERPASASPPAGTPSG